MTTHRFIPRLSALAFGTILLLAGCGSDGDTQTTGDETTTTTAPADVPVADDKGPAPDGAGMCVEDEPDCNDAVVTDDDPIDLPSNDDEPANANMPVDGGLTITEALNTDATGILAVRGYLLGRNNQLLLCEELVGGGESYACSDASVIISNLDMNNIPGLVFLEGTTFTEGEITVFGTLDEGVLEVNNGVIG